MFTRTSAIVDQLIQKYESRLGVTLDPQIPLQPKPEAQAPPPAESPPAPCPSVPIPSNHSEESKTSNPIEKPSHEEESKVDMSKAPYELFSQIDIRVGNIVECWKHPSSDNLYCEKIDVGEENVREIGSGLQKYVPISDMAGLVLVMANLKPRKLAGFNSNGMVMALHSGDLLTLVRPAGAVVGERVGLDGVLEAQGKSKILPHLNPKKKVLESCIAYFGTDHEGFACFGVKRMLTSAGFIKTDFPNARIS
jgi:methionine--tRNA ligase beta chain